MVGHPLRLQETLARLLANAGTLRRCTPRVRWWSGGVHLSILVLLRAALRAAHGARGPHGGEHEVGVRGDDRGLPAVQRDGGPLPAGQAAELLPPPRLCLGADAALRGAGGGGLACRHPAALGPGGGICAQAAENLHP